MPKAGEQIGPYTLVRQLGRGAFGVVWLAERRGAFATTQVAMKLALDDEPDLAAIEQESQLWANLGGHSNVLPIIEAERYGDYIAIVSEYAPGGSLDGWLKKNGGCAPSIEATVTMMIGILSGLEHLHSKKIIHRDLKPANILLQGETPRLADFGLARVLKTSIKTAGVAGTPAYMAPEVFDGDRSVESDIWSVGGILYQMLSGRLPFPQTEIMALIGALIGRKPDPLPDYVPAELVQIVDRALQKNPSNRFHSASEMRIALQSILNKGLATRSTVPLPPEEQPTARLNTIEQTSPDEVAATLIDTQTKKSPEISKQFTNKTAEQVPALATQGQPSATQEITFNIPATQKVLPQQPLAKLPSQAKANKTYQIIAIAVVLIVLGTGVGWMAGLFPSSQKASVSNNNSKLSESGKIVPLEDKNKVGESTVGKPVNEVAEIAKENEKLLKEITDKTALLEKQITKVPASEKPSLEDALKEMKDSLETKSLEENKPEELKAFYKTYLFQLNILTTNANLLAKNSQPKPKPSQNNDKQKELASVTSTPPQPSPSPESKSLQAKNNNPPNSDSSEDEVKDMKRQLQSLRQKLREEREMRKDKQIPMTPELRQDMKENRALKREKQEQLREFIRQHR